MRLRQSGTRLSNSPSPHWRPCVVPSRHPACFGLASGISRPIHRHLPWLCFTRRATRPSISWAMCPCFCFVGVISFCLQCFSSRCWPVFVLVCLCCWPCYKHMFTGPVYMVYVYKQFCSGVWTFAWCSCLTCFDKFCLWYITFTYTDKHLQICQTKWLVRGGDVRAKLI